MMSDLPTILLTAGLYFSLVWFIIAYAEKAKSRFPIFTTIVLRKGSKRIYVLKAVSYDSLVRRINALIEFSGDTAAVDAWHLVQEAVLHAAQHHPVPDSARERGIFEIARMLGILSPVELELILQLQQARNLALYKGNTRIRNDEFAQLAVQAIPLLGKLDARFQASASGRSTYAGAGGWLRRWRG